MVTTNTYTAFAGNELIVTGDVTTTVLGVKSRLDQGETRTVLVFEDQTGTQIDFDVQGSADDVVENLSRHPMFRRPEAEDERLAPPQRGPGRPRLGVVCREVSLLPRHWEWLEHQKGGASAALRRLVDDARKRGEGAERSRRAWEAAGKFMWAMCGNLPGFEEASRALYAKDTNRLSALMRPWPADVRAHVERLTAEAARLDYEAGPGSSLTQTAQ